MDKEAWHQKRLESLKSEAWAQQETIEAAPVHGVSALDPDFLFMVIFAMFFDAIDIALEIISIAGMGAPKFITIGIDAFLWFAIGGWVYWRTNKIIKNKQQQMQVLQKKLGRATAQMQKQLAKAGKKPFLRIALRTGLAFLGEIADIVALGIFPFWTITVVLTLREKGE
ncbi:MAG: hypothetical protein COV69_04020 [Parcubacteria group bacterium CG11_big_fil_rev_8_21_14_0_20_39_14]|nr:MAG: hypothetical protein COV69_04020 [Parcubacteria group bacterium CG11_big_fil_rev_8_21_14_0_20_39_14]PIS35688.1 MAG: hypothetical protein COT36_01105 [Parcubacteria group bacterium CG08_land_8_20_14_0_20_38_56]